MRRRLVLLATASTTMVALAFLAPLALLVRTLAEDRAMSEADQIVRLLAPTVATGDRLGMTVALQTAAALSDDQVTVYLADGRVVGNEAPRDGHVERASTGEAFTVEVLGGRARYTPLLEPGGTAVVRVEVPDGVRTAGVAASWAVLAALALALVLAAVLLADRLARTVVAPAREAAGAARALARGERGARAPVSGPPEIAEVATALNTLADRIEALLAAEREAAADLSHRLRTPLTALRLDIEALGAGDRAGRLSADLDAVEREVDRVIRDARRPAAPLGGTADAAEIVRRRTEFWSALAEEEGRPWVVEVPEHDLLVRADAGEVEAALDALLGNVFSHTERGTGFRVAARALEAQARIVVEDDGPGWPPGEVLDRGVSSGGSTGLGLDIVRRTAERHGGALALQAGAGGGARAIVTLPLAS